MPTATIDEIAEYLVSGYWSPHAFDTSRSNQITVDITGLTTEGRQLARWAMEAWEAVADIDFVETTGSAQIDFSDDYAGAYSGSTYTGDVISNAYVNIPDGWIDTYGSAIDGYAFSTYVHELGHALGLGHPGDYDGNAVYAEDAIFANDSWQVSIMSYFDQIDNTTVDASYGTPLTPMMADILAIQMIYGTPGDTSVSAGNTTWGANSTLGTYLGDYFALASGSRTDADLYRGNATAFTLYDVSGDDLVDLSFTTRDTRVDLRPGHFSDVEGGTGNVAIALGTVLEDLRAGSGNDTIIGNTAANLILGNAGDDSLLGLTGSDTLGGGDGSDTLLGGGQDDLLWGGLGDDVVYGGDGRDTVWLGEGNDIFHDSAQTGIFAGDEVHGAAGSDTLNGGGGNDTLMGDNGADVLRGGNQDDALHGGSGNDTVWGGNGRDHVWLDSGDDVFHDNTQSGDYAADTVRGGAGNDTLNGGGGNDQLLAGDGADVASGGEGNDLLNGGRQNDRLYGGNGDDTVVGANGSDQAWLGNGNDYYEDDEQIIFGDDRIWGGTGNDTILLGGGDDTVTGGAGADSFVFSSVEGDDLVTDYELGIDSLTLSQQIWNGGLTTAQVIDSFAEITDDALVFTFEPGYSITLAGIASTANIADDITLI